MDNSIINSFNGGMHSGIDPSVFPQGTYREMRNGHIFSRDEHGFVVTNISGPTVAFNLTAGFVPIGSTEFNGILYIMSYNKDYVIGGIVTPMIEFGAYHYQGDPDTDYSPLMTLTTDEGSGKPLRIRNSIIGYSKDHLVEMFPRSSYDGSINLYICDGLSSNMVVNSAFIYEDTTLNPLEPSDFNQFKSIEQLPVMTGELINGGYLKPGNYFVAIRYTTAEYNSTIFFNQLGPFCVSDTDKGELDIDNITLPRSIRLTLTGLDPDYKYVELAVIRYFGQTGVLSHEMYLLANKYIASSTIVISGQEKTITITAEELLMNNILLDKSKSHLQLNNRYYGANWKTNNPDIHESLAAIALKTIPKHTFKHTLTADEDMEAMTRDYRVLNSLDEMKYKAGEIYPFGLCFVIGGKYITDTYPICGYDENHMESSVVKNELVSDIHEEYHEPILTNIFTVGGYYTSDMSFMVNYNYKYTKIETTQFILIPPGMSKIRLTGVWDAGSYPFVFTDDLFVVKGSYQAPLSITVIEQTIPTGSTRFVTCSKVLPLKIEFIEAMDADTYYSSNKGLFRFPFAKKTDGDLFMRKRLHYSMMGVTFDFELAKPLMDGLDITSVIIMQGNRIVNCVSQGIVMPMIDRLVVYPPDAYWGEGGYPTFSDMIIGLGDGSSKIYFPYYIKDILNYRASLETTNPYKYAFPVHIISWEDYDHGFHPTNDHTRVGYVSAYYGPYPQPEDKREFSKEIDGELTRYKDIYGDERIMCIVSSPTSSIKRDYDVDIIDNNRMAPVTVGRLTYGITNYAFVSLDDDAGNFSGYIRSLFSIPNDFDEDATLKKEVMKVHQITERYDKYIMYALKQDNVAAVDNFANVNIGSEVIDMKHVHSEIIIPDAYGCISQMKSMYEVFGDMPIDHTQMINYLNDNFCNRTRKELMEAGIMLNRSKFKATDDVSDIQRPSYRHAYEIFQGWRFSDFSEDINTTPVIITNMSMKSCPYGYFKAYNAVNNKPYSMYVCEKYNKDPDSFTLYDEYLQVFSADNEFYHPIKSINNDLSFEDTYTLYKGDVFAQKITFRLNRFNHEPDNSTGSALWRHGQSVELYMESFKNHNLRCVAIDDIFMPYGEELGFNLEDFTYRSNSLRLEKESMTYNEGYHELGGPMRKIGIDVNAPVPTTNKSNRVYWSDLHVDGSFDDAYRNIRAGNYKDFNHENGEIYKIVKHNNYLFVIQDKGISQLYEAGRLEQSDDSSSIIIGDPNVLNNYTKELSRYGTQHPESVISTENGVYGIDWKQKKIWYIGLKVSEKGSYFYLVEDLIETKSLRMLFKDLEGDNYKPMTSLVNDLFNDDCQTRGLVAGYDNEHGKVYFTFHLEKLYSTSYIDTLVYDEQQGMFIGFYDYTPNIYLQYRNQLFMYNRFAQQDNNESQLTKIWSLEAGESYDNFYQLMTDDPEPELQRGVNKFKLVFYVNGVTGQKNLSNIQKEYIVHQLFASDNLLKTDDTANLMRKIEWETEYQQSSLDLSMITPVDGGKFWKLPTFEDHMWNIPIDVQSSANAGPNGTTTFDTFEAGSTMRGSWLKVTITYSGNEKIFIKNCITNVLNSYS